MTAIGVRLWDTISTYCPRTPLEDCPPDKTVAGEADQSNEVIANSTVDTDRHPWTSVILILLRAMGYWED